MNKDLTHVAGTFVIQADGAFLNGAGLGSGEDKNVTIPKTFRNGRYEVPYVSSQAFRRWLRNTMIDETGWNASELRAIGWNAKGNVNKIAAKLNPVEYPEDDLFGYFRAEAGRGKSNSAAEGDEDEEQSREQVKTVMRASPFSSSILMSLRFTGWKGYDEGYVHIQNFDPVELGKAEVEQFLTVASSAKQDKKKDLWVRLNEFGDDFTAQVRSHVENRELTELRSLLATKAAERDKTVTFIENSCTPLPYTTRFYSTNLQGVFCLDYSRVGTYWNMGDRVELEEAKIKGFLDKGLITDVTSNEPYQTLSEGGALGRIYQLSDQAEVSKKKRAATLLKALAVLRGGAKQTQFGTDVAPKALVLAGLSCGNPIFNHLFTDDGEGVDFKISTFQEILRDYKDRIVTPVFIGIRSGYLRNEETVRQLNCESPAGNAVQITVTTPIECAKKMTEFLP